jgi:hypothetical protein
MGNRFSQNPTVVISKKMSDKMLTTRTSQYIDPDQTTVDIMLCKAGAHARAIKPGGVITLLTSVKTDGYKRVINLNHNNTPQ